MTKRSFFFVLAAIAIFSGGLITLRGARGRVRTPRQTPNSGIRASSEVPPSSQREPEPTVFGSRIVAILVAAVVFGAGAYLGLGGSDAADAGAPTVAAPTASVAAAVQTPADTSISDEVRSMLSHAANADPQASAAPAPNPAPLAVAAAAETPQPAPEPAREPAAEPAAAPAPIPSDGFEAIICSKAWPCDQAIAVASCESGLDRNGRLDGNWATNGNNYGLFQINGVHADLWPDFYTDWMDPVKNTEWAYELWSTSGWRPWQCQP